MRNIDSIVIVRSGMGYKAHLRFVDSRQDEDLAAETIRGIHAKIDNAMYLKDRLNYLGKMQ